MLVEHKVVLHEQDEVGLERGFHQREADRLEAVVLLPVIPARALERVHLDQGFQAATPVRSAEVAGAPALQRLFKRGFTPWAGDDDRNDVQCCGGI